MELGRGWVFKVIWRINNVGKGGRMGLLMRYRQVSGWWMGMDELRLCRVFSQCYPRLRKLSWTFQTRMNRTDVRSYPKRVRQKRKGLRSSLKSNEKLALLLLVWNASVGIIMTLISGSDRGWFRLRSSDCLLCKTTSFAQESVAFLPILPA